MTKKEFIKEIAKWVKYYAPRYGIAVYSPIIAQAVLESNYGTSELGVNAFNFFGLKYTSRAASQYYIKNAVEQKPDGTYITVSGTKWCKFNSISEGVEGYFKFISSARYSKLKGIVDPKEYLTIIKAAGYATSHKYVDNLMNTIRSLNLTEYDDVYKKLYRVQVGAYRLKMNADKMHKKITNDKYSSFIKKEGFLYKVQVGAFGIYNNAVNLSNELKSKGYSVVIVEN